MKKLLLSIALLASTAQAKDLFPQIEPDKKLHMLGSYALTFTGAQVLHRLGVKYPELWAGLLVGTFGLYKELKIDEVGDKDDFKADVIGVGVGMGFSYAIRF